MCESLFGNCYSVGEWKNMNMNSRGDHCVGELGVDNCGDT